MKLIQQSRLFFKEGNSDKVYEIDLCELAPDKYLVNFRYGRRGSALKEGTKTPNAISRDKAELLFSELENEKKQKGYQDQTTPYIPLPSLDAVDRQSAKGAILHRLQDALTGTNTFKTEWKISRVIWKAGQLNIEEAIPLIIRLANRGDEMQLYCALWVLARLEAAAAIPLFAATASNVKQKRHIRNVSWEGLLSTAPEEKRLTLAASLLGQLPEELRFAIESGDAALVKPYLVRRVEDLPVLYLLCKVHPWLSPVLIESLGVCPFKPPYFKQIRSIYRLAQLRKDAAMVAVLCYRFEKAGAMFKRTGVLTRDSRKFVPEIGASIKVGAELKSEESKLAFSNFTKLYFQKNSVKYLRDTGEQGDAKVYLKLAVALLLQYTEADYSPAGERPLNQYGRYDYQNRRYNFILINYPECSESLLLLTILRGNDAALQLEPNLKLILGKRFVSSQKYAYSPTEVKDVAKAGAGSEVKKKTTSPSAASGMAVFKGVLKMIKGFFGKKNESAPIPIQASLAIPEEIPVVGSRLELYPAYWDAIPDAYVQLLMQARMHIIHKFAFDNLKAHPAFEAICNRFDEKGVLQLVNSPFALPRAFGFEVIQRREKEFYLNLPFVGQVLNCNTGPAREWAIGWIDRVPETYLADLDFVLALLFNVRSDVSDRIGTMLEKGTFGEERIQAILVKTIAELLHFTNTLENNELAKQAIGRLGLFAALQMENISWPIVSQLISSPLEANKILAGEILIKKTRDSAPTEIPMSLTELFLKSETPEVRKTGLQLLENYPNVFLGENFAFVSELTDSSFGDVAGAGLNRVRILISEVPGLGNTATHYFVYTLIRKEKFEGAHALFGNFLRNDLTSYWSTGLQPRDVTKLIHSQYRDCQHLGYDILKTYDNLAAFSLGQIISFGGHAVFAIRQWCWNYFAQHTDRIRQEKATALKLLDSEWDDTREFAFHFFSTEFTQNEWDVDTLISVVDSIRPDVEAFGKEVITRYFVPEHAMEYLTRLSEHPSINVQAFLTSYLSLYAAGNPALLQQLGYYFRSVLTRVNKGRVAKDRILGFLHQEAIKSEEAAKLVVSIVDEVAAQDTVQDKATCIHILTAIKDRYRHMDMHLSIKN